MAYREFNDEACLNCILGGTIITCWRWGGWNGELILECFIIIGIAKSIYMNHNIKDTSRMSPDITLNLWWGSTRDGAIDSIDGDRDVWISVTEGRSRDGDAGTSFSWPRSDGGHCRCGGWGVDVVLCVIGDAIAGNHKVIGSLQSLQEWCTESLRGWWTGWHSCCHQWSLKSRHQRNHSRWCWPPDHLGCFHPTDSPRRCWPRFGRCRFP